MILEADASRMTAGMAQGAKSVKGFQGSVTASAKLTTSALGVAVPLAATTAGIALGAFAVQSFKAARDYDAAFTRISAISNATADDIERWRGEVMGLAGKTAKAPVELADALFYLSSAGLESGQVMEALTASAKASAVGLGSTVDVANITASALNAYADAGLTAAQVTDTLVAAVREGRAEPEAFAGALGRILPIAAQAGVSFDEVAASLAGLSNVGLDVDEAVTAMRGALQAIAAPGKQAGEAMDKLGLSAQDLLDAISERGLFGALQLLDKAAKANTNTQADYIGVLRKVIPNVRALTGVLGLTGQEAQKVQAIFDAVGDSSGALDQAFAETSQTASFKLNKAFQDLRTSATKLMAVALGPLAEIATVVAESMELLLATLIGFAAVRFLPRLLISIGAGLETMGAAAVAGRLLNTAVAIEAIGGAAAAAVPPLAALAGGIAFGATVDALFTSNLERTGAALKDYTLTVSSYGMSQAIATDGTVAFEGSLKSVTEAAFRADGAAADMAVKQGIAAQAMDQTRAEAERLASSLDGAADAGRRLPKEIRESLVSGLADIIGTATRYKEAFSLSPAEMERIAASWVRIGETMTEDLRTILESDLKPMVKTQIAALPPEMRHAWVEGNAKQRAAIQQSVMDAFRLTGVMERIANQAYNGAVGVGRDLDRGVAAGIEADQDIIEAAMKAAVNAAIIAARLAAQAQSPSKRMMDLGRDLMRGLIAGVLELMPDVISALSDAPDKMEKAWLRTAKALEARASEIEGYLTRLSDRIESFRQDIASGFGVDLIGGLAGLEDMGGIGAYISDQVAQVQAFADALQQLAAAGLSQANIAELAGQGPAALPLAQALLASPELIAQLNEAQALIAQAQAEATKALVEQYFGPELERAAEKVARFRERLEGFVQGLGDELAELGQRFDDIGDALERLVRRMGGQPTPSNPAVGGLGGPGGASPPVTVNVYGDVTGEELVSKVEEALTRRLSRSGALFNGAFKS